MRSTAIPDLQLLVVDTRTGQIRTETALADRSGPAALDSTGAVVFAADSGLPTVDSIQHLDQGWLLLTAGTYKAAWRRGMRPQAIADTTAPVLQIQGQPAPVLNSDGSWTITTPNPEAGTIAGTIYPVYPNYPTSGYQLFNPSRTQTACFPIQDQTSNFVDPTTGKPGAFQDVVKDIQQNVPVSPQGAYVYASSAVQTLAALSPQQGYPLPIQFWPAAATAYTSTLTIAYYFVDGKCPGTPPDIIPNLTITATGTGTAPATTTPTLQHPQPPVLNAVRPNAYGSGTSITLLLTGGYFEEGSIVQWVPEIASGPNQGTNAPPKDLTTTYIDQEHLTATVPADYLTPENGVTIQVSNPSGTVFAGVSNGLTFGATGTSQTVPPPGLQLTLVLDQPSPASNAQVMVSVTLNTNAPAGGLTGALTLTFTPAANLPDDPSIFLDGNLMDTRYQPFTVPADSNVAMFGSQSFVTLDTGTTAGTFTLVAALGDASVQWGPYVISPAPPVIYSSTLGASADGVQVILKGFDSSQATSGLTFEFYATDGSVVSPGLISLNSTDPTSDLDATSDFSNYYQNPNYSPTAGKFQVTATFPVSGDVTQIAKVVVTLSNPSGTTTATAAVPVQ